MFFIKLIILAVLSTLVVTFSSIVIPELIYNYVENTKLEKFLEYYIVKACWILLTVYIDAMLIVGLCYLLERI